VPHFSFLRSSISSLTDSYFFQNACSGIRSKQARRLRRHRWYALPDRSIRGVASAAFVSSPKRVRCGQAQNFHTLPWHRVTMSAPLYRFHQEKTGCLRSAM
jgi:hypothetical protein